MFYEQASHPVFSSNVTLLLLLLLLCMSLIYKISYDLSYDYRKFIVRSTHDSDLKRAKISLMNIVS